MLLLPGGITAASAAVQVDAVTTNAGSATSYAHSHTVSGQDRLLVVQVAFDDDTTTVDTATYGGQALTQLQSASLNLGGGGDDVTMEVWYLLNPPNGSNTVALTTSDNDAASIGAISLTGVRQTTPIDGATTSAAETATPSVTVTSEPIDVVMDALATRSTTAPTIGAGQTQRWNRAMDDDGANGYGAGSTEPGASSVTMSWTTDNDGAALVGFNLNRAPPTGTLLAPNASQEFMLGDTMTVRFQEDTYTADVTNVTFQFDGSQYQGTEVSADRWEADITIPNSTTKGNQPITVQMRDGSGNVLNTTARDVVVTPRLSAVTVLDPVQGGANQTVTPAGVVDSAGDPLQFFCSTLTATPTPAMTNCTEGATNYSAPYASMTCTYTAPILDGSDTVHCRVYDGALFSATRSATYDIDSTAPSVTAPTFANATDRHAFNVSAVVTDAYADGGSCTVHASDDDGNNVTFAGVLDASYGASDEALCTYSDINSTIPGFAPTESIAVTVTGTDAAGNSANSTTRSTRIPNRPPTVSLVAPQDGVIFQSGASIGFQWSGSDPEPDTLNYTLTVLKGGTPTTTVNTPNASATRSLADGTYTWRVTARDWYSGTPLTTTTTGTRTLTVGATGGGGQQDDDDDSGGSTGGGTSDIDRSPPLITILEPHPVVEPGEPTTLTFRVTDRSGVDSVAVQLFNGGPVRELDVERNGSRYTTRFTLPHEGEYTVRVVATDVRGYAAELDTAVIATPDWTWSIHPGRLDEGASPLDENLVQFEPHIHNGGRSPLTFTVSTTAPSGLNVTVPGTVTVPAGENVTVPVEARHTGMDREAIGRHPFTVHVTAVDERAIPRTLNVTGTAVFTADAPFLFVELGAVAPQPRPGTQVRLPVFITNIGTRPASDTWVTLTLPEGWMVVDGSANISVPPLPPDAAYRDVLTVDIAADAPQGAYRIGVASPTANTGRALSDQLRVTVEEPAVEGPDPVSVAAVAVFILLVLVLVYYWYSHYGSLRAIRRKMRSMRRS